MVGTKLTPPSIQDGPFGFEPGSVSRFDEDEGLQQGAPLDAETGKKIALECYQASTNWINSGRRARWNDNLRAFQSLHPSGSKYLSRDYTYRSTLYRPKSREVVRRAEMQTAQAFFSNEDVVSVEPQDDNDPKQLASAEINKALLQYRLTNSIPWFLTLIGARQDCEVMGICIAKVYWKYEERLARTENRAVLDDDGLPMSHDDGTLKTEDIDVMEAEHDKPVIDLISPENFRFEPGCDWRNPVESSPYLIELMPMYVHQVQAKIKSGEWEDVPLSALRASTDRDDDVTRRTREAGRVPGKDHDAWKPRDFDICWVRANIVNWGGQDWHFYTLASAGELLSKPKPLSSVFLHGKRPYVTGFTVLETHKSYPSAKLELLRDLQRATNDIWNLRFDNIKLNLNPRQFVRTGVASEVSDVRTFMPGKVVIVNTKPNEDMRNAITWDRPPPMDDDAAYAEQDRINLDIDGLTGAFTNSSVQSSQIQQQSATGMHLMSGEASGMNEYELRIFAETFAEPVLKLLLQVLQAYETDPVILAIAGRKANLYQKYGIDAIDDELIEQELTTKVNVGVGSSNPQLKLRNFVAGADILGKIFGPSASQGANFQEVSKEVFGMLGYKDGSRFFQPDFDPRVQALQQQLEKLQGKGGEGDGGAGKVQAAQIQSQARLQEIQIKTKADLQMTAMDADAKDKATQAENWREMLKQASTHALAESERGHDMNMQGQQLQHAAGMQQNQQQHEVGNQMGQFAHEQGMQAAEGALQPQAQGGGSLMASPKQQPAPGGPSPQGAAPAGLPPQQDNAAVMQNVMQVFTALAGELHQGNSQLAQFMQQSNQEMVQALHQQNQEMFQAMHQQNQQMVEALAGVIQQTNHSMAQTANQVAESHNAVARAMTAKRRLVRGADGRAEGVELIQ